MKREKFNAFLLGIVAMAAVFGFTSVAFAAFSTTLKINGSATVAAATWDIHFNNISNIRTGNTYGDSTTGITGTKPSFRANTEQRILDGFAAELTKPGDYVEFDVDVVNAGTYNAALTSITGGALTCTADPTAGADATNDEAICNKLNITYTESGSAFAAGNTLNAGATKTVTVRISLWDTGYTAGTTYKVTKPVSVAIGEIAFLYDQAA